MTSAELTEQGYYYPSDCYKKGRADAIDEIFQKINDSDYCEKGTCEHYKIYCSYHCGENEYNEYAILKMLEQMKEQNE